MTAPAAGCELCEGAGGTLVFQGPKYRLIRASQPGIAAFYRLVWQAHVAEFSELPAADRAVCMEAVAVVDAALRRHLQPAKVNLASLGNLVPHLHWHLVARFAWDAHFPQPVWAPATREAPEGELAAVAGRIGALERDLAGILAAAPENRTAP